MIGIAITANYLFRLQDHGVEANVGVRQFRNDCLWAGWS
jgi:hypothetical protein